MDGEARIRLEAVVLDEFGASGFRRTFGDDPVALRAALLEATSERGGLPTSLSDAVVLGRVEEVAGDADESLPGRVGCPPPAAALPLWIAGVGAWDGRSRVVPVEGHAIVPRTAPLVTTLPPDLDPAVAAELVRTAHVPHAIARAVGPAARVTVIGAATTAGALAVIEAEDAGGEVTAIVTSLQEARLARSLGAGRVVVADLAGGASTADLLAEVGAPSADVTVVAVTEPEALATASWVTDADGAIVALAPVPVAASVATSSSLGARHRVVVPARGRPERDRVAVTRFERLAAFRDLVTWRAGIGPAPPASLPEDR